MVPVGEKESGKNEMRLRAAWKEKHQNQRDFKHARNGDHLLTPFECDLCIFRKLRKTESIDSSHKDILLLECIRRANLDAMWSRESSTVETNRRRVEKQLQLSQSVGLSGPYVQQEPFPDYDHCGYEVALGMLLYSRSPGRHSKSHLQFDTIRTLRSAFSNQVRTTGQSGRNNISMAGSKGIYQRLSQDCCGSLWFDKFYEGCKARMGAINKPNRAMSIDLIKEFFREIEITIGQQGNEIDYHNWVVFCAYATILYCLSLRGSEGFLLDLNTLVVEWDQHPKHYLVVPLLGRLKGEKGDVRHRLPSSNQSGSGIMVRKNLKRLIQVKKMFGLFDGPAISDHAGVLCSSKDMDTMLHEILKKLFRIKKSLFPSDIKWETEIDKEYLSFRTFRRSSDTQAMNANVDPKDVYVVNRWQKDEKAKGKKASNPMMHTYAQVVLLIGPFLQYVNKMCLW